MRTASALICTLGFIASVTVQGDASKPIVSYRNTPEGHAHAELLEQQLQESGAANSASSKANGAANGDDGANFSFPNDVQADWGSVIGPFGQCDGKGYNGIKVCVQEWTCVPLSDTYSQCLPSSSISTVNSTIVIDIPGNGNGGGNTGNNGNNPAQRDVVIAAWQQCGGDGFDYARFGASKGTTKLPCVSGYQCDVVHKWFYQCVPQHGVQTAALWSQCGGESYQGPTTCEAGASCKYYNPWYSQCAPK